MSLEVRFAGSPPAAVSDELAGTVDYGRLHDTEQVEFAVRDNGFDESSSDK